METLPDMLKRRVGQPRDYTTREHSEATDRVIFVDQRGLVAVVVVYKDQDRAYVYESVDPTTAGELEKVAAGGGDGTGRAIHQTGLRDHPFEIVDLTYLDECLRAYSVTEQSRNLLSAAMHEAPELFRGWHGVSARA